MIHAYNSYYLEQTQRKLASMFDIAVNIKKIDIDEFANIFLNSYICKAFEEANPIYISGKSSIELLAIVLNEEPEDVHLDEYCSPEYWLGYVLAYAQWYLNKNFEEIFKAIPCSKLLLNYFPYHEMDITHVVELINSYLDNTPKLKLLREKYGLSQSDLAFISGVSLSTI